MNTYLFFASLLLALGFLALGVEWMGFMCLAIAVITFIYDPVKKQTKLAREEAEKADPVFPKAKLEASAKGLSKQLAETISPPPGTEMNYKGFIHKTPQSAKGFVTELKEFLGIK